MSTCYLFLDKEPQLMLVTTIVALATEILFHILL